MKRTPFGATLKQICSDSYKNDKINIPDCVVGYRLTDEGKQLIFDLVTLIFKTEYFRHDTKVFLQNEHATYRTACLISGCADNAYTSRSRIQHDITRLKTEVSSDFFDFVVREPDIQAIQRYSEKLQLLIAKHQIKPLREGFIFKVPESNTLVSELDELDYSLLQDIAFRYSRKGKAAAQSLVNVEMVGYMDYLTLNSQHLSDVDKQRYEELKQLLD